MDTITDTEMLDWLEQQGSDVYGWSMQTPEDYPYINHCVFLCRNCSSGFATAREALTDIICKQQIKK